MKNIVLIRIDDRLIHGQVVTQWIKDTNGNRILIVDDKLVNDRMMMRILKAAAPPGVKVEVMTCGRRDGTETGRSTRRKYCHSCKRFRWFWKR